MRRRHTADHTAHLVLVQRPAADGVRQIRRVFDVTTETASSAGTSELHQVTSVVGWVTDESVSACMACSCPFTLFQRRHHCRSCGNIVCDLCSPHRIRIGELGHTEAQRACLHCVDVALQGSSAGSAVRRILVGTEEDGAHSTIGWAIDAFVAKCTQCNVPLRASGKYHCRACGDIVCMPCSPGRAVLPRRAHIGPQRVCHKCMDRLEGPDDGSKRRTCSLSEMQKPEVPPSASGQIRSILTGANDAAISSAEQGSPVRVGFQDGTPLDGVYSSPQDGRAGRASLGSPSSSASMPGGTSSRNETPHLEPSSGLDVGVDMERGWLRLRTGVFGWKKRYLVLDQGLLSIYESDCAEPPFGRQLKVAVLLTGAIVTLYGERREGTGVLFGRRRSSLRGSGSCPGEDGANGDAFDAAPSSDGARRRIHVYITTTKKTVDLEASGSSSAEAWHAALLAHAEVADEQSMGDFPRSGMQLVTTHQSSLHSFDDDSGGLPDDQCSEFSAISSFGSSISGCSDGRSRRRSIKRAAWSTYSQYLQESCGEDVLMAGDVIKTGSKGTHAKRRLVLTTKPRLFYLDSAGVVVRNYDMHVLQPQQDGPDTVSTARLRSVDTFDVLNSERRVVFRDKTGSAAAWVNLINASFEANSGEVNAVTHIAVENMEIDDKQDDAARGVYYPSPTTSLKVKKKDGSKVFINICSHPVLGLDEYFLQLHPVESTVPTVRIYDYVVNPSRVARYLSLRLPEGSDTEVSHAERRPLALEAISVINLKHEHLEGNKFVFPVTRGHYRGTRQAFEPTKRI